MSELVVDINDPILESDFMLEMAKQMHALDTYDTFEGMSNGEVLDPFVLTKERKNKPARTFDARPLVRGLWREGGELRLRVVRLADGRTATGRRHAL